MNTVTYQIPAISCGHCVNTIEMEIGEVEGVIRVKADTTSKEAVIDYQAPATEQQLKDLLAEINFPIDE